MNIINGLIGNKLFYIILILCVLLLNGRVFNIESLSIAAEKDVKTWVAGERVPLMKEASYFSEALCLLNYGQPIKIIQNNNIWVKVKLLIGRSWKYNGNQWVEADSNECSFRYGWININFITQKRPFKPTSNNRIVLEGWSFGAKKR